MNPFLFRRTACAGLLLAAGWCAPPADAQNFPRRDNSVVLSATLPESNEAMILSNRVEDAIQRGDHRLAIELLGQILKFSDELVMAPASRTYHPVWRQVARLLEKFPPAGVQAYRAQFDAEVAARFQEAAASHELAALRELFRVYRLSSSWPAIGRELAAHLMEQGGYGEAIEVLRELQAAGDAGGPEIRLQLAAALANAGAWHSAWRMLADLRKNPPVPPPPRWEDRLAAIQRWLESRREAEQAPAVAAGAFQPRLEAGAVWTQPLLSGGLADSFDYDGQLADAIAYLRQLPVYQSVLDGDLLFVRLHRTLWAFDPLTLTPRWQAQETDEPASEPRSAQPRRFRVRRGQVEIREDEDSPIPDETERLFSHVLGHTLSASFGQVYTIEPRKDALDTDVDEFARPWFRTYGPVHANELAARDAATGRPLWRAGQAAADPLRGVAFQDAPLPLDGQLIVPVQREQEIHLCALDPATGRLLRETPIVGPPLYLTASGGRCLLALDETTLYVCTGNGVVAALRRDDFRWKWAATYSSTLADRFGFGFWQTEVVLPRESNFDRPVLTDDLLIVAPVDSDSLIALDRFSGREQWRVERGAYPFVVGAVETGLVVGGNQLTCLDLADGRTVRWRSCPLEITGRPALRDQRVFVPTRRGLVVLDGQTGRIVRDEPRGANRRTALNLLAAPEALFGLSPGGLTKYPDPRGARAQCEARLARDPDDPRARLTLARLDLLEGAAPAALARLETWRPADEKLAAAREQLLGEALLALARAPEADHAERLDWLRRAAALALPAETLTDVQVRIGDALEKSGQWREAFRHYREFLLKKDGGTVPSPAEDGLRLAGWLHAANRLRHCAAQLPAEEAQPLLNEVMETVLAKEEPALLERLRFWIAEPEQRQRIDEALSLLPLPPEIAIRYLPPTDDPARPAGLRRRLHLQRWETHVALGMLEEARADHQIWRERFAGARPGEAEGARPTETSEQDRVDRLKRTLDKLEQTDPPFTAQFQYQWKLRETELIGDSQRSPALRGPTFLARHLGKQQLWLCRTANGLTVRETPDGVLEGRLPQSPPEDPAEAMLGLRGETNRGGPRLTMWPGVTYDWLAVAPVNGGLVCLGLGSERAGGGRLWEYEIREWSDAPSTFSEQAVAGPEGVYFAPRDDRIVLLGWSDGRPRWQRQLPELRVRRLELAGDRLVIIGENQEVATVDAVFGDRLQRWPLKEGAPRAVEVVADTILLWSNEQMHGLDPQTLTPRWSRPCAAPAGRAVLPERGWLAWRERSNAEWSVLDARTGELAFAAKLANLGDITAIAVQEDRLFVAAATPQVGRQREGLRTVQVVAAFDAHDGRGLWVQVIETSVPLNRTQLLAQAEYIPLLLASAGRGEADARDVPGLEIQLLNKRSGQLLEPTPITSRFKRPERPTYCGPYLLATPTRVLVQAAGSLVAFGNSDTGSGP